MNAPKAAGFADKMISLLDHLQTEFETFRVQAALGKMNASDHFEELKKEYSPVLRRAVEVVENSKEMLGTRASRLKGALEHLQVQMALGKADAKEAFSYQKVSIEEALKQLQEMIGWEELENPVTGHPLRHDLERLKLNLELLRLRFELKMLENEEEWKNLVVGVIEHWKEKIETQRKDWNKRTDHLMVDVQHAYDHLRKVLQQV